MRRMTHPIILWQTQWRVSESDVVTSITVIDSYNSVVCEYSSGISMVMTVGMCGHCVMCGVRLVMNTSCQENWKYWSPHVLASHQYRASLPVPWSPDHLSVTSSQSEASHQEHWPIRGQVMTTYCARDSLILSCRNILCHQMLGHQAPRPGSQGNNTKIHKIKISSSYVRSALENTSVLLLDGQI